MRREISLCISFRPAVRFLQHQTAHVAEEKRVLLANPRGFCAGVRRAIDAVQGALQTYGPPVYVRRAIVHNQEVVIDLQQRGAIFVQEIDDIPPGAIAVLSAHGSARSVKLSGEQRGLRMIDAICPLVAKVHAEVEDWHRAGRHVLLIAHQGHPEVVGTLGQLPAGAITVVSSPDEVARVTLPVDAPVAFAVQTTFSMRDAEQLIGAIQARFNDVVGPKASDICYATTNRQLAIEAIAARADLVLVVGDRMSSNAARLVEVARAAGCAQARLVAGGNDLPFELIEGARTIGVTAAASTPEFLVQTVCEALRGMGFMTEEVEGVRETMRFRPVRLSSTARRLRQF